MDSMISSHDSNEIVNSITHFIGTMLAFIGTVFLIVISADAGKWVHLVSFTIYGVTLFLSMLASTWLHFTLIFNRYYRILGILDHDAIFLLIAGSYTPICLVVLGGMKGWILFSITWFFAAIFIVIKSIFFSKMGKIISTIPFLIMGWPLIFYLKELNQILGIEALITLLFAGILYTVGAVIFIYRKPNPFPPYFGNHEIWHILVLIANGAIFYVMWKYIFALS